jgi:hypothetical protein
MADPVPQVAIAAKNLDSNWIYGRVFADRTIYYMIHAALSGAKE